MLMDRTLLIALGLTLAAPAAAMADTYTLASFSGAINGGKDRKSVV